MKQDDYVEALSELFAGFVMLLVAIIAIVLLMWGLGD